MMINSRFYLVVGNKFITFNAENLNYDTMQNNKITYEVIRAFKDTKTRRVV